MFEGTLEGGITSLYWILFLLSSRICPSVENSILSLFLASKWGSEGGLESEVKEDHKGENQ